MQHNKETVPNGYYTWNKPGVDGHKPIVHVMEVAGQRVVSFINRDFPTPLKDVPAEIAFTQSPINSNFDVPPEEIKGREEELMAYLLESLCDDPNLRVSRDDKSLCISRLNANGMKRFFFTLKPSLDAVETIEAE